MRNFLFGGVSTSEDNPSSLSSLAQFMGQSRPIELANNTILSDIKKSLQVNIEQHKRIFPQSKISEKLAPIYKTLEELPSVLSHDRQIDDPLFDALLEKFREQGYHALAKQLETAYLKHKPKAMLLVWLSSVACKLEKLLPIAKELKGTIAFIETYIKHADAALRKEVISDYQNIEQLLNDENLAGVDKQIFDTFKSIFDEAYPSTNWHQRRHAQQEIDKINEKLEREFSGNREIVQPLSPPQLHGEAKEIEVIREAIDNRSANENNSFIKKVVRRVLSSNSYLSCTINPPVTVIESAKPVVENMHNPSAVSCASIADNVIFPAMKKSYRLPLLGIPIPGLKDQIAENNRQMDIADLHLIIQRETDEIDLDVTRYRTDRIGREGQSINVFRLHFTRKNRPQNNDKIQVILGHGNGGGAAGTCQYGVQLMTQFLNEHPEVDGAVCEIFDYPGSAASGGTYATIDELGQDTTYLLVKNMLESGIPASRIFICVHSLGGLISLTALKKLKNDDMLPIYYSSSSLDKPSKFLGNSIGANILGSLVLGHWNITGSEIFDAYPENRRFSAHNFDDGVIPLHASLLLALNKNKELLIYAEMLSNRVAIEAAIDALTTEKNECARKISYARQALDYLKDNEETLARRQGFQKEIEKHTKDLVVIETKLNKANAQLESLRSKEECVTAIRNFMRGTNCEGKLFDTGNHGMQSEDIKQTMLYVVRNRETLQLEEDKKIFDQVLAKINEYFAMRKSSNDFFVDNLYINADRAFHKRIKDLGNELRSAFNANFVGKKLRILVGALYQEYKNCDAKALAKDVLTELFSGQRIGYIIMSEQFGEECRQNYLVPFENAVASKNNRALKS